MKPSTRRRPVRWPLRVIVTALLAGMIMAPRLLAQAPEANAPAAPTEAQSDPLGRETPAGSVRGFIRAASDGNFERAAEYLDSMQAPQDEVETARELAVVLDRSLSAAALGRLSGEPRGDALDGLPPTVDRVEIVKSGTVTLDILLTRVTRGDNPPMWLFAAESLEALPAAYEEIRPPWIEGYLWPPLTRIQFLDLKLWQWLLLPLLTAVILAISRVLSIGLLALLRPFLFRLTGERTAHLREITAPVRVIMLGVVVLVWLSTTTSLSLLPRLTMSLIGYVLGIVGLTWLLLRLIDISAALVEARIRTLNRHGEIAIVQLSRTMGKVLVVLVGGLVGLYIARVDLTAALAGVGIGGLALAFAAQKTIENLFGGVMIISDGSVRVGDFCSVGTWVGTVEKIGLRSTRLRTLDRTLVAIPNSQMATQEVENYAVRDQIRFKPTLALRYGTSADQLRFVLAEIRRLLYEHPMVETETARVRFVRLGTSSLDVEIFAYVRTDEFPRYLEVQEDLLLRIMEIIEASGTAVALPSSTTYLARDPGLDEKKTDEATAAVRRWREERDLPFPNFRPERIAEFNNTLPYPPADSGLRRPADQR